MLVTVGALVPGHQVAHSLPMHTRCSVRAWVANRPATSVRACRALLACVRPVLRHRSLRLRARLRRAKYEVGEFGAERRGAKKRFARSEEAKRLEKVYSMVAVNLNQVYFSTVTSTNSPFTQPYKYARAYTISFHSTMVKTSLYPIEFLEAYPG